MLPVQLALPTRAPVPQAGAINLIARFDRMIKMNPLFLDVTWGAGGSTGGEDEKSSMTIASTAQNYCGIETMLHLTCADADRYEVSKVLRRAKQNGIRNIMALRGDPPRGQPTFTPKDPALAYVARDGVVASLCAFLYGPSGLPVHNLVRSSIF
jgi:5,10-methylenetetrahydrofolate reductase